jgi:hypothetical protein
LTLPAPEPAEGAAPGDDTEIDLQAAYERAGIQAMLDHDGPVIVDCMVAKLANCFPMIPSGASHVEMLLDPSQVTGEMSDEAKALV